MADQLYSSAQAIENKQSFYNVIRMTGHNRCPFFESLGNSKPFKGDPKKGHTWDYRPGPTAGDTNKHAEGGKRADVTSWAAVELKNELQIFKKTSGITGSQAEAMTIEYQKSKIEDQKALNRRQLQFDLEKAFLADTAPVARAAGNGYIGEMAGIKHYITGANILDCLGTTPLSYKEHIEDPLKKMWSAGVTEKKIVMCGVDAKSVINELLNVSKRYGKEDRGIVQNVSMIEDAGWDKNVPVIANPHFATDEILVYAPSLINPVLLRAIKDRKCSDPEYDAEAWEDLFEITLQMLDPDAAIWVKNIKLA